MKKSLLDLSNKLDGSLVDLYAAVAAVASDKHWMIIGATARDVFLHEKYGLPVLRATRDVDLAVQIRTWQEFQELKDKLLESGKFKTDAGAVQHRIIHSSKLPLDIIPFGSIADKNVLKWPDSTLMSVQGYAEAFESSEQVIVGRSPDILVKFATPMAIVMLKLIAWDNNPQIRAKDIEDLAYIVSHYVQMDNWDRLIGPDEDAAAVQGLSMSAAGARLIGRDIAKSVQVKTREALSAILQKEIHSREGSKLLQGISRSAAKNSIDNAVQMIENLLAGLNDNNV